MMILKEKFAKSTKSSWIVIRAAICWFILAIIIGAVCGLVGSAFHIGVDDVTAFRMAHSIILYFLPVLGVVIVLLYKALDMENDSGTNQIIASVRSGDRPSIKLSLAIFVASILTHLGGGSAGREGAALQIGGSLAAGIGRALNLNDRHMNVAIMCGMSGLFSALFGTPLTATMFSIEVISIGIVHYSALFPCLISSLISSQIAILLGVAPTTYKMIPALDMSLMNILRVAAISAIAGLVSIIFCISIHGAGKIYQKYIKNQYIRVIVGGVLVILVTLIYGTREYNGAGGEVIVKAMNGEVSSSFSWLFKIILTAITLGAGYRGGEIVPTFFVGSTLGCAIAPLVGLDPAIGASICLIAMFCGAVNCPMASFILSIELFGAENIVFYAIAASISYLISGKFSLYKAQKIIYSKIEPRYIDENMRE